MNNCYPVNATTINAYWAHRLLLLTAEGHAECADLVFISQSPLAIFPPEYQIMTCACPIVGSFPYKVSAWFYLVEKPQAVTVHTASGPQKVEVKSFPLDLEGTKTPAVLASESPAGEVLGIALNSSDINIAISDAVSKLQELYPGNVNATLTETGVVSSGPPVGISLLYVRMKQEEKSRNSGPGAKPTKRQPDKV